MKKAQLKKIKKKAKAELKELDKSGGVALKVSKLKPETRNSIVIVLIFLLAIVFIFSLFGLAGQLGVWANDLLLYLFGWGRYVFPVIMLLLAYFLLRPDKRSLKLTNYLGLVLLILSYSGFLHLIAYPAADEMASRINTGRGGGYLGLVFSYMFDKLMGPWAAGVVLFGFVIVSLLVLFDISLKKLYEKGNIFNRLSEKSREFFYRLRSNMETTVDNSTAVESRDRNEQVGEGDNFFVRKIDGQPAEKGDLNNHESQKSTSDQSEMFKHFGARGRRKIDIPLDLLSSNNQKPTSGDIEAQKRIIYKTLQNFGIEVEMGETKVGPTVTQYTLKPAEGVRLSHIITLSNDLSLALAAHPIRIEAPIPGKSLVGIEVPNQSVAVVKLKEVLSSREFKHRKSNLMVGLGKDVAGHVWIADLDTMPHLMIAGATGSGKSVCLNSLLLSLLYQNSPDQLKFILVDPKRVELSGYNGIPYLLTPVINDVRKTINALRWVVAEMDRRFDLLSKSGHRDIHSYNKDNGNIMPYLVLAIDELADLMSVASSEVEAAIIRLAQMARAVGIHLVLATQRPSVDIITGLIKANITNRIAFSVASATDSRTILDTSGAEKLLGRGDMLYISSQLSKPKRLQGAYVSGEEISRVLGYLKSKGQPEYLEEVTEKVVDRTLTGGFDDLADDDLLVQAKNEIIRAGKASASFLQRRLRIGYARAARLLDILEDQGIIGPGDGAKPREVLISAQPDSSEQIGAPDLQGNGNEEKNSELDQDNKGSANGSKKVDL